MPASKLSIAVLHSIAQMHADGLHQGEIAATLGISQATVCRGIHHAIQVGLLKITKQIRFHPSKTTKSTDGGVELGEAKELADRLSRIASAGDNAWQLDIKIVSLGQARGLDARLQRFAHRAASYVGPLLSRSRICGVTWGLTLKCLVDAIEGVANTEPDGPTTNVLPLCGEPLGEGRPTSLSSSGLAERLASVLNDRHVRAPKPLSLGLVPAFFPVQFDETELAVAWGLVGFCEAYLRIFGNPDKSNTSTDSSAVRKNPLIHRIDTVLTSISIEGRPFGFGKAASLIAPQLSEVLVGDIGGVPLKKPNLPPAHEDLFRKLYQRWTGLRKEHLQTCAARAQRGERTESAAGVILAAMGEDKAGCVIEAVRARLVNHIVIDTGLKRAIERIIRQD